ncbi:acetyl-CoA synthetase-like protein [Mollisia scopiformis]|uniref:Acetyl-CoA synthetase-like protein n=1 Tax=Mollisia scopiformis TaxID=149040 RepID=A0A194XIC7_MOLSC|nr:acetyl-CoA synthetase-like protein [Mollisia scopiformis]KUJ19522.1 acetyl-CoA synthetase-like protein [Mollisia scopiformis]
MHQPASFLSSISRGDPPTPPSSPPEKYLRWSFNQIAHASHTLAASLAASGIKPGMRIISFVNNGVEWHIMLRAALELNCLFAPLNPRVAFNEKEARHMMAMIGPSVLLVQDSNTAEHIQLHAPEAFGQASVKLFSTGGEDKADIPASWQDFAAFAENGIAGERVLKSLEVIRKPDDVTFIFTTSGTTNLPKGCPYTNSMCAGMISAYIQHSDLTRDPDRVSLCHMATSHIMGGVGYSMGFHCAGLKVVHPAATFDPGSSLKAINLERASDMPCVPALVYAMLAHPDFDQVNTDCIKHAHLGATTILPEVIKMSMEQLKADRASEAYGMTETGPALAHRYYDLSVKVPEIVTSGTILPGAKVRVCDPETNKPVPRGAAGECHIGGSFIIKEYWVGPTQRSRDAFYTDEHGLWIRTGDQAVMHDNGECQIVGRYKDMIIRGGENISPSAIESIILSKFDLVTEVVGVPDEIAGEIPIAVMSKKKGQEVDVSKVRQTLIKELGAAWVPEEIIDIKTLGIDDFPRTATGKVIKTKLQKMVIENRESQVNVYAGTDLLDTLTRVWTKLLGVSPGTLTPQTSIHDWADSLIQARFSAVLMRETGLLIQLQNLIDHPSIEGQAKLLSARGGSGAQSISDMKPDRDGPPGIHDMVHTSGDEARYKKTQDLAIETLKPLGLGWEDVEDVIPMNAIQETFVKYRRPQTSNHRHAFLCNGSSVDHLEKALKATLAHHSMLRTMAMYFDSHTSMHITIRPSEQWFSKCIRHLPAVKKAEDLAEVVYGDVELDNAHFPGPMMRFIIVYVEETKCAGLVYMVQHSIFDAVSLQLFLDDFDAMLTNPTTKLKPHVPYKAWADSYYNLQYSPIAKASVNWQANRLRGIYKNPEALFPIQRAPEWFKGSSEGWIDIKTGKPGPPRKALTKNGLGVKGITGQGTLKDIQALKIKHNIEGSQIVKAALAVVTTRHTKQPYALFGQSQAGRTWPFMLPWQANRMPPAMDVDGPAVQGTINKLPIHKSETVLDMLARLQAEQYELNRHAYAPMNQIVAVLNGHQTDIEVRNFDGKVKGAAWIESEGGEGDFVRDAFKRQVFNWLPVPPVFEYKRIQKVQVESRTDLCCLWNCIMLDQTTLMINPTWDDAQLYLEEVEGLLDELLRLSEKFAAEENWGKRVEEFV